MLDRLTEQPEDAILSLIQAFRDDPREAKVDLGVGVYRDASGHTPVMAAVKAAEERLWRDETTKTYTGLAGEPAFARAVGDLLLGEGFAAERRAAAATPGGTGAVRQALELARMASPELRVFVPVPTWPNHLSILKHLGIETVAYRYYDAASGGVDAEGMLSDLAAAGPDDVVLLHGCCHNPTGADPSAETWRAVADLLSRSGALALVDIAYLGLGDGLEEDGGGLRILAGALPQMLVAASCSKNFGIYRERAGLLLALGPDGRVAGRAQGTLAHLNRQNYSFPPDHGARLVTMIPEDGPLREMWAAELAQMRTGILALRRQLVEELARETGTDRFAALAGQRGMFSLLPAGPEQVASMRRDHGIYMVGDGRINVAGLNAETVPLLARAMIDAGL